MALRFIPPVIFPMNHYYLPTPALATQNAWLNDTISQPYFPRYDINLNPQSKIIFPMNYYFLPTPARAVMIPWLTKTISQPYFPRYDINLNPQAQIIFPVDHYTLPTPAIARQNAWLNDTISQPLVIVPVIQQPIVSFVQQGIAPNVLATLNDTISQPVFMQYNINGLLRNFFPAQTTGILTRLTLGIGI